MSKKLQALRQICRGERGQLNHLINLNEIYCVISLCNNVSKKIKFLAQLVPYLGSVEPPNGVS